MHTSVYIYIVYKYIYTYLYAAAYVTKNIEIVTHNIIK